MSDIYAGQPATVYYERAPREIGLQFIEGLKVFPDVILGLDFSEFFPERVHAVFIPQSAFLGNV
jgi:hypothetical protein